MNDALVRIALVVLMALLVSCSGAGLGESCDTPGSPDECDDGLVCNDESNGQMYCRALCAEDSDCGPEETCNGVSNSAHKACEPD